MSALRHSIGARFIAGLIALAAIVAALAIGLLGVLGGQRASIQQAALEDEARIAIAAGERSAGALVASSAGRDDRAAEVDELEQRAAAVERALTDAGVDSAIAESVGDDMRFLAAAGASRAELGARYDAAASALAVAQDQITERSRARRAAATDRVETMTRLAVLGGALTIAVVVALALLLRRRVLRPVEDVSRVAERIASGELSGRVAELRGGDEVARMHRSFNAMAAALETALEESRSSERMREDFFAVVSHELRTPLTSIVGYVELLSDDAAGVESLSPGERHRFIEIVDRNSRHLLRLVGDLLLAAQIDEGRMELDRMRVDLAGLAREAVEEIAPRARAAGLTLASAIEGPFEADADPGRLRLAFRNLLSNAVQFTPRGGEIGVSVAPANDAPAHGPGATVEFVFWDTGVGVPESERARLFERFYRSAEARHAAAPGVGLGLVITRAIVEAHGGRLELDGGEGGGSTFRCLLPLG